MEKLISVIGAGAWGTTLANLLAGKGYDISLWCLENYVALDINDHHENKKYLPGIRLSKNIRAFSDISVAVNACSLAVFVVPSQFLRKTVQGLEIPKEALVMSATKGIEKGSLKLATQILEEELDIKHPAAFSGPNLSKEIALGFPAASVVACKDIAVAGKLQEMMSGSSFRIYTSDDTIGVELGGALKNVIAIAAGVCDGLSLGDNSKSALLVRGIAEISRLGKALGAKPETLYGLSGIGDLITTCASSLSRNHSIGVELSKGRKLKDILKGTDSVAEGIETSVSAKELSEKHNVDMPISNEVYKVLFENKDPKKAILSLMTRPVKKED